jgi:hypothetical protein
MIPDTQATEEELKLMTHYGITHARKSVYFCKGYKYDKLSDAINYASATLDKELTGVPSST